MTGYLVNDFLTCIPNTKTFWHDLLDWIPSLKDKTNGSFSCLAEYIESLEPPDYIIRNASYFRHLNINCRQISLLQDVLQNPKLSRMQIDVCNNSGITVFNSPYVYEKYKDIIQSRKVVIPLGTDFDFFKPQNVDKIYDIIFIGASNVYPKGFDIVTHIISNTGYRICLVMKDNYRDDRNNVEVFNRVDQTKVRGLINKSKMLICTSKEETLHLAGIESAACNVPVLATDVGIYHGLSSGEWGMKITNDVLKDIRHMLDNIDSFSPRGCFLDMGLDKKSCRGNWIALVNDVCGTGLHK